MTLHFPQAGYDQLCDDIAQLMYNMPAADVEINSGETAAQTSTCTKMHVKYCGLMQDFCRRFSVQLFSGVIVFTVTSMGLCFGFVLGIGLISIHFFHVPP